MRQKVHSRSVSDDFTLGRKYQFMEVNTQKRGAGLKEKIPDIQKTLDTVRFLKTRKVSYNCLRDESRFDF